ncbi:MAG: hypothetical protein KDE56_11050 [Anaerolineales bacterium]|nr:hypothetical protein [Anaerolineales bacterium]
MLTNKLFATNKLRAAFMLPLALLLAAFLALAISPAARAAVQSLFSFNGVEVTVDPETGKLRADGNSEAILYQDDNAVFIMGEDGQTAVGVSQSTAEVNEEMIPVPDLAQTYPDFVLPTNVPTGYQMDTQATVIEGMIVLNWRNEAGHTLTYQWGTQPAPTDLALDEQALAALGAEIVDGASAEGFMEPYQLMPGPDGSQLALYNSESNGVPVLIVATDTSLTAETLQAMVP